MPIYVYRCSECGHEFERLLRRAVDNPKPNIITDCPKGCDAPTKRIPTASTFHLAGDGWASDGYKGKKKS